MVDCLSKGPVLKSTTSSKSAGSEWLTMDPSSMTHRRIFWIAMLGCPPALDTCLWWQLLSSMGGYAKAPKGKPPQTSEAEPAERDRCKSKGHEPSMNAKKKECWVSMPPFPTIWMLHNLILLCWQHSQNSMLLWMIRFLVNITSCCCLLSICFISDLQNPPKTTSHFCKFILCWHMEVSWSRGTPRSHPFS